MTVAALSIEELEVVRRALSATFQFFDFDFETRLGVTPEAMRELLRNWPSIDDSNDDSDGSLAVNNALNDLLHGIGISNADAQRLTGVDREEMYRIYRKWAESRGWSSTGVR